MNEKFCKLVVRLIALTVCCVSILSCSSTRPNQNFRSVTTNKSQSSQSSSVFQDSRNLDSRSTRQTLNHLNQFYKQWKGTPYRYGGISKNGIDCSGFVYLAFRQLFEVNLPRMTESQRQVGINVQRKNLQVGDMVFFKTGKKVLHVGIYTGNDQFVHASTSIGVTKSSLSNQYWSPRFLGARRILY